MRLFYPTQRQIWHAAYLRYLAESSYRNWLNILEHERATGTTPRGDCSRHYVMFRIL